MKKYAVGKKTTKAQPWLKKDKRSKPVTKKHKLVLLITGIALILAALIFIALAAYNILTGEALVGENLTEAKKLVEEFKQTEKLPSEPVESGGQASAGILAPLKVEKKPVGNVLGELIFNSLDNREVPIIEGAEPAQLSAGAGHHIATVYPGQEGNCLIFGHRNTVFKGFNKLKIGDTIQILTEYGSFDYIIRDMQVVLPLDSIMYKDYETPVLTLVTCYPFGYVGHAPKRYVVICDISVN